MTSHTALQLSDVEGWAEHLVEELRKFPHLDIFDTDFGYEAPLYNVAEECAYALLASSDLEIARIGNWTYLVCSYIFAQCLSFYFHRRCHRIVRQGQRT